MSKKLTTEEFIQRAKQIHGDKYDYSLVQYKTMHIKVDIICKIHGIFNQKPNDHVNDKCGCPKCKYETHSILLKDTIDSFKEKSFKIHKFKYDYSLVDYINCEIPIKIICNKCSHIFFQKPFSHISGRGCPKCKLSKGEIKIDNWLKTNKIKFETQKRFSDCKNKRNLPFDFYLPEYNTCIEFDGEQHFNISNRSKDVVKNLKNFNSTQHNDKIKDEYCQNNNIRLIRISYKDFNNIENILINSIT